jgi:iron complex transport system ATP-binding protein
MPDRLITLSNVSVWLEDRSLILNAVSWSVNAGEHWALLGANGAGKTTLLNVATARRYPSRGSVSILDRTYGQSNMLSLREEIAIVDPQQRMYEWFTLSETVLTGASGTVQPDPAGYSAAQNRHALEVIDSLGLADMSGREIGTLSHGERQRVRLARALMSSPKIVVLDEPASGLDLPAREALIRALVDLATAHPALATIIVSHHLEELPPTTSHAALMRHGSLVAAGPIAETLTDQLMSSAFGIGVLVSCDRGRWYARGSASWGGAASEGN